MATKDPTNCDTCKASLERGYCYVYTNGELTGAMCFGCDRKEMLKEYLVGKRLRTRLVEDNSLQLYYTDMKKDWHFDNDAFLEEVKVRIDIHLSQRRIFDKIKEFEKEVWFKGLQKQVRAAKVKGVSAKTKLFGNFSVLTYSMCARTMITIENDTESVTMMTTEDSDENDMGFRGVDATEQQALSLIQLAIELYHNEGGTKLVFEEDTKVSMGF